MTNRVEMMRSKREEPCVDLQNILSKIQNYESDLLCVFEGKDDPIYYRSRLYSRFNSPKYRIVTHQCNSKQGVFKIKETISKNKELSNENLRMLFFVDRDYDENCTEGNLYCTPCYSIENFIVNTCAFENLLDSEIKIRPIEGQNENQIKRDFLGLYNDFEKKADLALKELNAWLKIMIKNKKEKLNLNNIDIKKFIKPKPEQGTVEKLYEVNSLKEIFNIDNNDEIDTDEFKQVLKEFDEKDLSQCCRGKYRLEFYRSFLKWLKQKKEICLNRNFSKKNLVSELVPYATTPECLTEFLDHFVDEWKT